MEKMLVRKNNVFHTNSTTAHDIIMLCKDLQSDKINATQFVINLHEKSFLIFPGIVRSRKRYISNGKRINCTFNLIFICNF